jgi:hypothetical protein
MEVTGTVVDLHTGVPVEGVRVQAWSPDVAPTEGEPLADQTTTAGGEFQMKLVAAVEEETFEELDVVFRVLVETTLVGVEAVHLVSSGIRFRRPAKATLHVDDPFASLWRVFVRAFDESGAPLAGVEAHAADLTGRHARRTATVGAGGRFTLTYQKTAPHLRLWLVRGAETLVAASEVEPSEASVETDLTFAPAAALAVAGRVVERGGDKGAAGVIVELLDRSGRWTSPVATAPETGSTGAFELAFPRVLDPPAPTFRATRRGELVGETAWEPAWSADGALSDVRVEVEPVAEAPTVFRLLGQALDRVTRRGVGTLRVEAWNASFATLMRVAETDSDGRFELSLPAPAPGQPPDFRLRFYRDSLLLAQPPALPVSWSAAGEGTAFVEIDAPDEPPKSFRLSGRVIDEAARSGLFGLRVEAWDRSPRDGGFLGVAADTGVDGAFEIVFPPTAGALTASLGLGAPDLFFRIYLGERLLATRSAGVSWTPEGVGVTVIEIPEPAPTASTEVGLHELGESIASTVDRVQTELARYPTSMGAYVLDEIDLDIPVEMRVDELGQVRTKVVDSAAAADGRVGKLHMRVRPVLGASQRRADVPDQPLSVLEELSTEAIQKLEAERIYSVEDLARAARSAAGRAALAALELGVDLEPLLGKAALLALPVLPRAVREALVALGVADPDAFASHGDPATLATKLSEQLGQQIAGDDVRAWQARVRKLLAVPLPTEQQE